MKLNSTIKWNEEGELIVGVTNVGNVTVDVSSQLINDLLAQGFSPEQVNKKVLDGDLQED